MAQLTITNMSVWIIIDVFYLGRERYIRRMSAAFQSKAAAALAAASDPAYADFKPEVIELPVV